LSTVFLQILCGTKWRQEWDPFGARSCR